MRRPRHDLHGPRAERDGVELLVLHRWAEPPFPLRDPGPAERAIIPILLREVENRC